ncbi:MAG: methyltransferase domain-containing protein [Betaproteobacteria bacterium]
MPAELEFTGERFLPGAPGAIAYEHWHRYAFALRFARGRNVLDAACGEGYGTAFLAQAAQSAVGIDIDADAVRHAREVYGAMPNLRFESASVTALPLPDASVDVVVSFETIEHLPAADQPRMLSEFARVLTARGVLVLSSPNRLRYSDARDYRNPFHLHELYREDLSHLLEEAFGEHQWYHQVPLLASAVWSEAPGNDVETWCGDGRTVVPAEAPDGLYYIVVAARTRAALPAPQPRISLFTDRDDSELRRAEAAVAEELRLDGLLRARDTALTEQAAHVRHLEELLAFHERVVAERDTQLLASNAVRESHEGALSATRKELVSMHEEQAARAKVLAHAESELRALEQEKDNLEAALAAQERIIGYRQTLRWWLQLPWLRARTWWQRRSGR